MKFNVNEYVKVKLNAIGIKRHWERWLYYKQNFPEVDVFKEYTPPKVDEQGYHTIQLWSLMKDYGDLCGLGLEPPFETEIIIEEKDAKL